MTDSSRTIFAHFSSVTDLSRTIFAHFLKQTLLHLGSKYVPQWLWKRLAFSVFSNLTGKFRAIFLASLNNFLSDYALKICRGRKLSRKSPATRLSYVWENITYLCLLETDKYAPQFLWKRLAIVLSLQTVPFSFQKAEIRKYFLTHRTGVWLDFFLKVSCVFIFLTHNLIKNCSKIPEILLCTHQFGLKGQNNGQPFS